MRSGNRIRLLDGQQHRSGASVAVESTPERFCSRRLLQIRLDLCARVPGVAIPGNPGFSTNEDQPAGTDFGGKEGNSGEPVKRLVSLLQAAGESPLTCNYVCAEAWSLSLESNAG